MSSIVASYRMDLEGIIFSMQRDVSENDLNLSIALCTPTQIGT